MAFVHLHTHSEYSLLDGANRIPDLLDRVQALGMDSLAITDHGNLHGAWQFYSEARAHKIRPILGFEAYLAFGDRHKRERPPPEAPGPYSHLVLLARNRTGYQNLVKLSSIGFLEGFYRRPRIDRQVLEQYSEGLIGLAACLSGEIALYLRPGNYEAAKASAQYFARVFGPPPGGFWLEVQDHGLADEKIVVAGMLQLARELGLPVVSTNDAHYLRKEDAEAHDVLLAIGTGKDLDDPNRFRFFGQESYVKSEREMRVLFPDHPEVVAETQRVANLCEFDFEKRYFLPQYPRPAEFASDNDLLVHLARAGAAARYSDPLPQVVHERLDYELQVISHTGYAGYFLIVYDIVKAAKDRGIPVGPGRGSAAGSLVAYALAITDIDPLKFDLLFERFLNPERISMPDIDLDFCFERRGEVIQYIRERYGRDSVGQIITFGTLKARAAFRDVARTLRVEPGEVDRFTKMIPAGPGISVTLAEASEKSPELRQLARQDERVRKILELGTRIEGLARHASVHAAGVVIAPGPLTDYVPVCLAPQDAVRSVRRSGGDQRAAPSRPARHRDAPRVHQPEARPRARALPAPRAGADPPAHIRRDHLSGAGDAHRQRARRLLARRSRRAAQSGGEEGQGADPARAGPLRRAGPRAGARSARDRGHRGPDRDLRPVRLQQVARRRIFGAVLSDGVAQGALRARVPVGAVVLRDRQYRQRRALHQRGARARPRGAAAGRQRVRVQVHGGRRPPAPLRPRRDQERRRGRDRVDSRRADRGGAVPLARRPVRSDRPAPLQQARPRGAHRRRRLRLARRAPRPARGGARRRVRRGADPAGGARIRPGSSIRRACPAPHAPRPAPRCRAVVGT